jgi:hypothetical protein
MFGDVDNTPQILEIVDCDDRACSPLCARSRADVGAFLGALP